MYKLNFVLFKDCIILYFVINRLLRAAIVIQNASAVKTRAIYIVTLMPVFTISKREDVYRTVHMVTTMSKTLKTVKTVANHALLTKHTSQVVRT